MKHILYLITFEVKPYDSDEDWRWAGEEKLDLTSPITEATADRSTENFDYHQRATENNHQIKTTIHKLTEITFEE